MEAIVSFAFIKEVLKSLLVGLSFTFTSLLELRAKVLYEKLILEDRRIVAVEIRYSKFDLIVEIRLIF